MHSLIKYLFFWIILSIASCKTNRHNEINAGIIKQIFVDSNYTYENNISQKFDFKFCNDTVYKNNKEERIENALNELIDRCLVIDKLNTNIETKQYAKSLLLAEWVHGTFNYQFLGPDIGLAETLPSVVNFNTTNLNNCYQLGNSNTMALWCEDRSNLFVRLIDSLFKLPSKMISVKPTHIFPIVKIADKYYIIDPYDPFILFNEDQDAIIDYELFKSNPDSLKVKAIRSSRSFGNAGELLSKRFYKLLRNNFSNQTSDVGNMIATYLKTNQDFLSTFNDNCTSEPFIMSRKVFPLLSNTNALLLCSSKNSLPQEIKKTRLFKNYLGLDCKIKK